MASFSHLLDGSASYGNPPAPVASTSNRRRKRPSKAAQASFDDDDEDYGSRRSSARTSNRPKRYNDEVYEDDEYNPSTSTAGAAPVASGSRASRGGGGGAIVPATNGLAVGGIDPGAESDEEGDGLLRSTAHIWREPLQHYILSQHSRRQQVERAVEEEEASRKFLVAAKVVEFSEKRLPLMKERKEVRMVQLQQEEASRVIREQEERMRYEAEEEQRQAREREKEERLKKQRDAARKRREEERLKKEHDNEVRKQRAEEARLAKLAEQERKANLTPEERAAEEKLEAEKLARERLEAQSRIKQTEEELSATGRGARKRRRPEGGENLEDEAARALAAFGGYGEDDYDDLLDDEIDEYEGGTNKRKGKGRRRSSSTFSDDRPSLYDANVSAYAAPDSPSMAMDEELEEMGPSGSSEILVKRKPQQIAELERKIWTQIAKKDIPKVAKIAQQSSTSRQFFTKRLATVVTREARKISVRTKPVKDVQNRAKRVMRELMMFMKGNEKREREYRKKVEKEAMDKARKEEEVREAKRTARKLNFLITQTELYSHFVGSKIKTNEAEDSADTAGETAPKVSAPEQSEALKAAIAAQDLPEGSELKALDFDDDDESLAAQHARRNAQNAINAAKEVAAQFDAAAKAQLAATEPGASNPQAPLDFDGDDLNFQNPSTGGDVVVTQPKMLAATLKEYQLKGLNWLANLYEQGINGILADEMGLGKTVQSISLMAYLAEVHNIWGPFLVISPASTLHNWQQEITKFVPNLKALPYWGTTKDRAVLRKFWNRKSIRYDKDAPFHVVVTSYQLAVVDEKYFNQVRWQYMVLDEAQAIKSSGSTRWKTLLGFRCRNRLLLTGTPIQNSMHELWALLHFIMPSLFDSHDEFSEWFSQGIEKKGDNKNEMNEHQLRRLHMILKPFMLRRIKKNVQNELGDKIEIDLYCDLTPRQKVMYRTLRENISITDLVARASSLSDDDSVKRLMNLIMQFRKVCNHPELFERADVTAPFAFASLNKTASIIRDPEVLDVPYATRSSIEYTIPKTMYREGGILNVPGSNSKAGSDTLYLDRLMNIWQPAYISQSLKENNSTFAFARGLKYSPAELYRAVSSHGAVRLGTALQRQNAALLDNLHDLALEKDEAPSKPLNLTILPSSSRIPRFRSANTLSLVSLGGVEEAYRNESPLTSQDARFYQDAAVAPAIEATCSDRSFSYENEAQRFDELSKAAIFGIPPTSYENSATIERFEEVLPGFSPQGFLGSSSITQMPLPSMQVPQLQKLILDSGKLAKLDQLLTELKAGGHRCLIYFQMTRMIDLFEEYLAFRQHKYLRLDGSSTISERRDMVTDWQTKPELFIFLLSTRAGGLGINLTAADTVIFYDSDWNPSNDAQAMDRAHRLGQTKQVTVYRLITKDTVDERIVQLARNKKLVQDAVVGSSGAAPPSEGPAKANEVVSLLLDDNELQEGLRRAEEKRNALAERMSADGKKGAAKREETKRQKAAAALEEASKPSPWDLGADDEDAFSFFANPNQTAANDDDVEQPASPSGSVASGSIASETKPKPAPAPRKRKPELDENGQPKPKRKRRSRAEMEIFRAEEAARKAENERQRLAKKAAKEGK
ncbi:uncharacterized protein JCM6883_007639 [Sporobolomyces salmoneus]|uniref:uncharacterized protein n=1 Tax=Sporobolomyces salmoneus TaxID=183962 RepID=UPI003177FEB1